MSEYTKTVYTLLPSIMRLIGMLARRKHIDAKEARALRIKAQQNRGDYEVLYELHQKLFSINSKKKAAFRKKRREESRAKES